VIAERLTWRLLPAPHDLPRMAHLSIEELLV